MINTEKYTKITYVESKKTKAWMDKKLKKQEQSSFIRDAITDKIKALKLSTGR